jgi:hypothetical protein
MRLNGAQVKPAEVITTWKERFPAFWPTWDHFYQPLTGIALGEVALINMLIPGDIPYGLPLSTGVLVLYADEKSFTFMTPEGHMFAGWITFSAYEEEGSTVAQIEMLMRANDPAYELGFRLGASRSENKFWQYTLAALAAHFGVVEPVQTHVVCIDPRVQWSQCWNIWQNAAIRTFLYRMLTPVRWMLKYVSRGASTTGTQALLRKWQGCGKLDSILNNEGHRFHGHLHTMQMASFQSRDDFALRALVPAVCAASALI